MSTRCNVLLKDRDGQQWYYRHSEGYPAETGESLKRFLRWVLSRKIRDNIDQAGGWLILLGAVEYQTLSGKLFPEHEKEPWRRDGDLVNAAVLSMSPADWECGAYEPTTCKHGDIEYLYIIDLEEKCIYCHCEGEVEPFWTITADNINLPIAEPERS